MLVVAGAKQGHPSTSPRLTGALQLCTGENAIRPPEAALYPEWPTLQKYRRPMNRAARPQSDRRSRIEVFHHLQISQDR